MMSRKYPLKNRVLDKIEYDTAGGCWLWAARVGRAGYGHLKYLYTTLLAHRASYMAFVGPIPDGKLVLHKCDVRECVNPSHLFIGTHSDNMVDMVQKGRRRHVASKRLSEDMRSRIISLHGMPVRAISRETGINHSTVRSVLKSINPATNNV